MKTVVGIFLLLSLVAAPAFASPAFSLEELLERAKYVCIAEVDAFDGTSTTLTVQTNLRGDPGTKTLSFKVDTLEGKPEKGKRYFVFSQGLDPSGRPANEIKLSQGIEGQAGYCGWIMLPIEKLNGEDIVKSTFSAKFPRPEKGTGGLTLEQAKRLVREADRSALDKMLDDTHVEFQPAAAADPKPNRSAEP